MFLIWSSSWNESSPNKSQPDLIVSERLSALPFQDWNGYSETKAHHKHFLPSSSLPRHRRSWQKTKYTGIFCILHVRYQFQKPFLTLPWALLYPLFSVVCVHAIFLQFYQSSSDCFSIQPLVQRWWPCPCWTLSLESNTVSTRLILGYCLQSAWMMVSMDQSSVIKQRTYWGFWFCSLIWLRNKSISSVAAPGLEQARVRLLCFVYCVALCLYK